MISNSRLNSRLISKGKDEILGRWSWIRLNSAPGRKLLVIPAYQVSQLSPKGLGSETTYMQQWRKYREMGYKGEPQQRFW